MMPATRSLLWLAPLGCAFALVPSSRPLTRRCSVDRLAERRLHSSLEDLLDERSYDEGANQENYGGDVGHDYIRDRRDIKEEMDVNAVDALLAERLAYKKGRDFDAADRIRDELLAEHGVVVNDRARIWSSEEFSSSQSAERTQNNRGFTYTGTTEVTDELRTQVEALLETRADAKWRRDFDLADEIRAQIYELNVEVRDREKTWRVRRDEFQEWSGDAASIAAIGDEAKLQEIADLLKERSASKLNRDYERADAIRDQLSADYKLYLHDRSFTWRLEDAKNLAATSDYARQEGDEGDELDEEHINTLLTERLALKKKRSFVDADKIQSELTGMGIRVDDVRRLWTTTKAAIPARQQQERRVMPPMEYIGIDEDLSAELKATIEDTLAKRDAAKSIRDYVTADELRAELAELKVNVRDRDRTWSLGAVSAGAPFEALEYKYRGAPLEDAEFVTKVEALVAARSEARKNRDFTKADTLRDELFEMEVVVSEKDLTWRMKAQPASSEPPAAAEPASE